MPSKKYKLTFDLYDGTSKSVVFEVPPGEAGPKGDPGADGKTPERGVDYWTEADKAGIVEDVLTELPIYSGEVESV